MNIIQGILHTMKNIYDTLIEDIGTIHADADVSGEITDKVNIAVTNLKTQIDAKDAELQAAIEDSQKTVIALVEALKRGDTNAAAKSAELLQTSLDSASTTLTTPPAPVVTDDAAAAEKATADAAAAAANTNTAEDPNNSGNAA